LKIAVVGAGWVGCHLSKIFLDKGIDFDLFDKEGIFSSTSSKNQNRLHQGYHYARSKNTRVLCKSTFSQFKKEYGFLTTSINKNLYSVHKDSILDLGTYKDIFLQEDLKYIESDIKLNNCLGTLETQEELISFTKAKSYFTNLLSKFLKIQKIQDLEDLSKNYTYVINCTNNSIPSPNIKGFYELSLTLLYNKINPIEFGALTIVDGPFFSIFPYQDNLYTLTDVEHTPLLTNTFLSFDLNIKEIVDKKRKLMEQKTLLVYPTFLKNFKYHSFYVSTKSKTYNNFADRSPAIDVEKNIINIFTGKIQGIFKIEEFVLNHII